MAVDDSAPLSRVENKGIIGYTLPGRGSETTVYYCDAGLVALISIMFVGVSTWRFEHQEFLVGVDG